MNDVLRRRRIRLTNRSFSDLSHREDSREELDEEIRSKRELMWTVHILLLGRSPDGLLYYTLRYEPPIQVSDNRAYRLHPSFYGSCPCGITCLFPSRYTYSGLRLLALFLEITKDIAVLSRSGASPPIHNLRGIPVLWALRHAV